MALCLQAAKVLKTQIHMAGTSMIALNDMQSHVGQHGDDSRNHHEKHSHVGQCDDGGRDHP